MLDGCWLIEKNHVQRWGVVPNQLPPPPLPLRLPQTRVKALNNEIFYLILSKFSFELVNCIVTARTENPRTTPFRMYTVFQTSPPLRNVSCISRQRTFSFHVSHSADICITDTLSQLFHTFPF